MHAVGLVAALAVLALTRPPAREAVIALPRRIGRGIVGHRLAAPAIAIVWLLLALYLNRDFRSYSFSRTQLLAFAVPLLVVAGFTGAAVLARGRRAAVVFDPLYATLAIAIFAGLLVPVTLDVPDGLTSLIHIKEGLLGGGINSGVSAFATPLRHLVEPPLRQALAVFDVAALAALVGIRRRDPLPGAWFLAAAILGVMAQARQASLHYFAPAYLVSVFGALWLIRTLRPRELAVAAGVALVAIMAVPQFKQRAQEKQRTEAVAAAYGPSVRYAVSLLKPGEVVLAPPTWPSGSDWYSYVVQPDVNYTPPYPYTVVEADSRGVGEATEQGLRPAYYTGPLPRAPVGAVENVTIGDLGSFRVRVLTPSVVRILRGPGS
jgi:hypothetical protein